MNIIELENKLRKKKNEIGLVGGSIKINEYDEAEHYISAGISPQGWNIQINLKKDFNPIQDKRQKAFAIAKKIENGLETLISHVGIIHEPAHWELPVDSGKGCPFDIYNHDKILEAVKTSLPEDKKSQAGYVSNAFEDLIINPRCKEFNKDFSGQVLFWDWEGISCKEKGLKNYTPFYEAFVKLNMHLWGDKKDKALLMRHYSNDSKINKAVNKVVKDLNLQENIKDTFVLFNKSEWPEMAATFTKDLLDLLEEAPTERLSAFSQEGQGEGEKEDKNQAGNGIEQKISTREGKEEIAYGRYSSNERQSSNITSYEQLDALYRKLAKSIPIKVEAMTKEHGLKITPLNFRPFDEEKDDISKIKASKLFLTEKGIEFGYPKDPLTIKSKSKIQRRSFPDFKMVILDNSGSMNEGINGNKGNTSFIPWGDNSKYHYSLLGFYGIENFLQNQGIAQYIDHGLSLFSSGTRYKEGNFFEIDKVRKLALSPEFGNTYLDAKILTNALKGRESFILSISDGEIGNWNSEKQEFKNLVKNNHFAHIQIGSENQFTKDLESFGMPVYYVNSGNDLSKLMVDLTLKTYKRFTKI